MSDENNVLLILLVLVGDLVATIHLTELPNNILTKRPPLSKIS
jgi:hypothetical protein